MAPSRITLVAHTHWDREWYEPFEVFRAHLVEMLDEALDEMERDERLSFTLDGQVSLVDDYLELRPTAEPRIRALVEAGRLHVGPWYTQADTLLAEGEAREARLSEEVAATRHRLAIERARLRRSHAQLAQRVVDIYESGVPETADLIFGDGGQTRDFVYVGDVVRALLAAVGREGGVFNVGTGVETTVLDLHRCCAEVAGVGAEPRFEAARLGDVRRSVLDVSLAARELGWSPQVGLQDGLRLTLEG